MSKLEANRRAFLSTAVAGAAAAATGCSLFDKEGKTAEQDSAEPEAEPDAELPLAPPVDVATLSAAALKMCGELKSYFAKRGLQLQDPVLHAFAEQQQLAKRSTKVNRKLRQRMLLSTDFLQNGEDPSQVIRFVAYYDPYRTPCYNPARLGPKPA